MTGQQLKNSILQMAVQGKLVPQDPNDEPASVLLERIRKEKEQLIKEGKIKKEKNPSYIFRDADNLPYEKVGKNEPVCIADDVPFEIPESWEWVRLGEIFQHNTGKALNSSNRSGELLTYITTSNLYWNRFKVDSLREMYFSEAEVEKCTAVKGDLLVCEGGDIGRAAIWPYNANIRIQNHIHRLRAYVEVCTEYYYYIFFLYKHAGWIGGKGIGIKGLSSNALHSLIFPLPPLHEQQRIVTKLKMLEPFFEKYTQVEKRLNNLNVQFPDLLKTSILQEAVQGKLVPQDPADEPASILMEHIRAEKQKLVAEGKIKKDKHESVIFRRDNSHYEKLDGIERCIDDEIPFEIPDSWEWCRLKTVGITQTGNTPSKAHPEYIGDEISFITPGDIQNGTVFYDNQALSMEGKMVARECPKGSILQVCIGGSIGKVAIANKKVCFNQQINSISPIIICSEYIYMIMQSPYFLTNIKKQAGGTATPIINRGVWDSLLIPIAPISEQNRIIEEQRELFDKISLI